MRLPIADCCTRSHSGPAAGDGDAVQVQAVALSPDGALLLSVDTSGRAMLVLRHTRVLLHRWTLKEPCRCARFSPDGRFIAMAVGRVLWVRSRC